ncbi:hypothetical protein KY289_036420 [Solanum tuberosum]|nr:hypothetical protein KY289_036420 [Solanum tuberosum]
MVVADDRVCDQYIEEHPEITPNRKYGSPIYEKLCHTFTRPIATGEFVVSSTDPGATLRNGIGPDNPKRSKSSDMDQNQKHDLYSIAYCVVALNDMSGIDKRLAI